MSCRFIFALRVLLIMHDADYLLMMLKDFRDSFRDVLRRHATRRRSEYNVRVYLLCRATIPTRHTTGEAFISA